MHHTLIRFVLLANVLFLVEARSAELSLPAEQPMPSTAADPAPAWLSRVNAGAPGTIPPPRPFKASYRMSWSDLDAGKAEVSCTTSDDGTQIVTRIAGGTLGLARTLYQVDGTHLAVANRHTLRPVRLDQTELEARKRKTAHIDFSDAGAERKISIVDRNTGAPTSADQKPRTFSYPDMYDMHSTLLYLRSLPLNTGDSRTLITMTAGSPYLATIKVVGRGPVKTTAGSYQAIEYSIALSRINKHRELESPKAFKSAHVWLSDDADRLVVKAEAQVFIGTVTLDLTQVSFGGK